MSYPTAKEDDSGLCAIHSRRNVPTAYLDGSLRTPARSARGSYQRARRHRTSGSKPFRRTGGSAVISREA